MPNQIQGGASGLEWEDAITNDGRSLEATRNQVEQAQRQVGTPQEILARFRASLKSLEAPAPKMHKGGIVKKTGPVILKKGERVLTKAQALQAAAPAPSSAAPDDATQPAPPQAPAAPQGDDSADTDEAVAKSVNLLKLYSNLNSAIGDLFQNLGLKPSLNMPHQDGQSMADHINNFGSELANHGGITANMILATHTRHDPKGGSTQSFPSEKLRQTIIPKNFEPAIHAAAVCRNLVNKSAAMIPDEPAAQLAKSQIALISHNNLSGMSAFDAGASLIAIVHPLFQALARNHNLYKHGEHVAHLTAPRAPQDQEQPEPEQA
jgi:hypothetical protein